MRNTILTKPFLKLGRVKEPHLWRYANNNIAISKLDNELKLCHNIASTFVRYHTTCLNECFHSVKAKFVPKNYNLGNTADVSTYASILQLNIGNGWINQLYGTRSTSRLTFLSDSFKHMP